MPDDAFDILRGIWTALDALALATPQTRYTRVHCEDSSSPKRFWARQVYMSYTAGPKSVFAAKKTAVEAPGIESDPGFR